jgi:glycosyltransferase involved in cell wall biosynthesis
MTHQDICRKKLDDLKICVLLPTYNNASTLESVISDVKSYTDNIVVVDDGSTDNTARILTHFPAIQSITITPNRGKGMALRKGFAFARQLGYQYCIALDSDGQHYPKDLIKFVTALNSYPRAIIIGSRNMNQSSVPAKSSFGNRFSNFWFKIETGKDCPDTQSGEQPGKALTSHSFQSVYTILLPRSASPISGHSKILQESAFLIRSWS